MANLELEVSNAQRIVILRILAAASFLVLFQAYLVVPLIPTLAIDLNASSSVLGLLVPAYTIPYGLSTLFYGPLSDRLGRKPVLLTLLVLMTATTFLLAFSQSATMFLGIRIVMGLTTGGIIPITIALLGDLYPYEQRGKPIGLLYGVMAGGMTFGSTLGAYLNPLIGWRIEFLATGGLCVIILVLATRYHKYFYTKKPTDVLSIKNVIAISHKLLSSTEGSKLYSYILLNGMFHSGIFSWLAFYFSTRYHLGDQGIGIALLGYGVPGMLLGLSIGKAADTYGRNKLIPIGLLIGAISVTILVFNFPLWISGVSVALLSLGYDMTQPLFAGLVTQLGNNSNRGQAVGLSACMLFLGYGIGALVFQFLIQFGITYALLIFVFIEALLAVISINLFKKNNLII